MTHKDDEIVRAQQNVWREVR